MPTTRTVEVTQDDIDQANAFMDTGEWNVLTKCPVALAVNRLGLGAYASWGYWSGQVFDENDIEVAHVQVSNYDQQQVSDWVYHFDDRMVVEPINFDVIVEEPCI